MAKAAPQTPQPLLSTILGSSQIQINSNFSGAEFSVFGAIHSDGPLGFKHIGFDMVMSIKGPLAPVTIHQKNRQLGAWLNTHTVRLNKAHQVMLITSTRPLHKVMQENQAHQLGLDPAYLVKDHIEIVRGIPHRVTPFVRAYLADREMQGLISRDQKLELLPTGLFHARIHLPQKIPLGDYTVTTYLVQNGNIVATDTHEMIVQKDTVTNFVASNAREFSLAYGLFVLTLALLIGISANAIFGRR